MITKTPGKKPAKAKEDRTDRLKAALKANLARRKAQARVRSDGKTAGQDGKG